MKNLRKIAIAAALSSFVCNAAFAAEIPYSVSYDYLNNTVSVSGAAEQTAKYVTMQVLAEGKSFEDLAANPADGTQVLYRYQQDITDGKFMFEMKYDTLKAGEYSAKLVTDGTEDAAVFNLNLVNGEAYSAALSELKAAADIQNLSEFKKCIESKNNELGFDLSLYRILDGTELLKPYMNYVKGDAILAKRSDAVIRDFTSFMLMAALNENKVSSIGTYLNKASVGGSETAKDFAELAETAEEQIYVTSKMTDKQIKTFSEFENALKEGLILGEIRFASGYGGVKEILTKYGAVVGITGTASADVYKAMCGKSYKDAAALLAAYNALKADSGQQSGGGSSGGGGKVSSGMNATYPTGSQVKSPSKILIYFNDIDGVDWAVEAILALADKKIVSGKSEGYFKPNDFVTREEFAKILVCALKYDQEGYGGNIFADVSEKDRFCPYINIGYNKGLMQGVGDGRFGVGESITRQDMAVMICNAMRNAGIAMPNGAAAFEDKNKIADYAVEAVDALHEMKIINGISETEFDPLGSATRAQAAKIVYELLKYFR